jgi:5-methylcytosine-specific restriction endonuclease McrA
VCIMQPWEKYPKIWKNESDYWNYIRGSFRRIWSRYPVKLEFKKNNSYPPPADYKGRAKNMGTCALCGEKNIAISKLEVDHKKQVGSFNSRETAFDWFWELLCEEENMQLVHNDCHKIKSYADRMNITFQEAMVEKEVIKICKMKLDRQWLIDKNITPASNAKERKRQILEYLKANN